MSITITIITYYVRVRVVQEVYVWEVYQNWIGDIKYLYGFVDKAVKKQTNFYCTLLVFSFRKIYLGIKRFREMW